MAAIVDTEVLGKLIAAALVAGIGVTAIFGLIIYGTTRFADMRRQGNTAGAVIFGAVAVLAMTGFAASLVVGLAIMTDK